MFIILTQKVDSVQQLRIRIEVQENRHPCGVEGMFVAEKEKCFYYLVPYHGTAVGNRAVTYNLLNLFKLSKLAVVHLCKEEGM